MKGKIFKLKKDKLETWKAWALELATNYNKEATETLKEEGLQREYGGIFNMNDEWYGYIFTDKQGNPSNQDKEINRRHREVIQDVVDKEYRAKIETLYSLEVDEM